MTSRWGIAAIAGILVAGLVIGIYLAQRSQMLGGQASGGADSQLVCDAGPNAYDSNTITVTNNTGVAVNEISSNVFRCEYEPDRVRVGYYKCEDDCTGDGPDCQEGIWDPEASTDFSLAPGESKTVAVTVGPCEIVQIDTQNDEINVSDDPTECFNTRSSGTDPAPPNRWQGGIAFGIKQNSEGYDATSGFCDIAPTPTIPQPTLPASTPTPQPTAPPGQPTYTPIPTATPTRQPTAPPGQPTYTPIPTATPAMTSFIPTNTPIPYIPPSTPIPTQPVSGGLGVTVIGIVGGIGLLMLMLL